MCWSLTQASVAGQLLVDLLHTLDVEATGLGVVHHGLGVVHADDALGRLLHALWGVPGIVDVLGREASKDGQVASSGGGGEEMFRDALWGRRRMLENGTAYRM